MKKTQRTLLGCIATCICFFVVMLAGSFKELTAGMTASTYDALQEASASSAKDLQEPALAPNTSPTPTLSPMPSLSPTPTLSPTPSPTPTNTPTPTPSPTPTPPAYIPDITISSITVNLNIRKGPGTDNAIIGKLPGSCYAIILEELDNGWTKISTGTIEEGYVSAEFLFSPEEVMSLCDREKRVSLTSAVSTLNVRSGPGTQFEAITQIKKGQTYVVQLAKSYEDWIAIELSDGTLGYVSEEYIEFSYNMDTGLTLKEIEDQERQKAIERAMARARIYNVAETKRAPVTMTDEELYLFATVIYTEAGNQRYEGMLAVANVILNRMADGYWGTTLKEVLFAPGQFEGAKKEYIERAQRQGIPDACYKAAKEALAGKNNIGDFLFFRTTSSATRTADYVTYTVFYIMQDHVFYKKNW